MDNLLFNLEKIFISSPILGLGASFLAGIIVSFSPCIYPLIPITLGVVGAASTSEKTKSFFISLVFVLGIALVYTVLGIISSLFGMLIGNFFVNPITYLFLSILFFVLGGSLLSFIKINIPFFSPQYTHETKKGFFSIFILGIISGLAIIPCNFPVLGAILSLISLKKNVIYGAVALFFFSMGYGMILIIVGTSTTLIKKLPKKGFWLILINKFIGFIFIFISLYFLIRFLKLII
ncbi:MAG: sulfite exporter TauE/SafE family protein [Candidatus Omnitrophica bacterium]|nr:sulfite exporter TauE/SafE family protein [Candidatus Omnitrophota bacterium]MCK5393531.1 sulfite exporter TauE/SafE family protein [Candidatus Omnitrophota bacterium]